MRLIDKYKAIQALESDTVPYNVICAFGGQVITPTILEDTISIAGEGDHSSVEALREAIGWLAGQLGGKVKWEKL